MSKLKNPAFILALTTALALPSTPDTQVAALDAWATEHFPKLQECGLALLKPPFSLNELDELAKEAVIAAQELKGIFKGTDRAVIAQKVLVWTVQETCPPIAKPWIEPLMQSSAVAALIESAFRKLFPEKAGEPAVVDAPEVEAGGIQ